MREAWTDERLDDLNQRVENGFRQVDQRFDKVERDLDHLRSEMTSRFDTTQHLMIQIGAGMLVTMLIGFLSILVALA